MGRRERRRFGWGRGRGLGDAFGFCLDELCEVSLTCRIFLLLSERILQYGLHSS